MSLIFNLKSVASAHRDVRLHGTIDLSELPNQRSDMLKAEPLKVELVASADSGLVVVEGTCDTTIDYACSRCLTEATQPFSFQVREVFSREEQEDEDIHVVSEDTVDLRPYMEENLHVALPFAPLCREDCRGLCPTCGTNRNETSCDCTQERIDPRLEGLKDFFK